MEILFAFLILLFIACFSCYLHNIRIVNNYILDVCYITFEIE